MPCRAGGQLLPLAEDDVGPALPGEVIERGDADNAAADHHDPSMGSHPTQVQRLGRNEAPFNTLAARAGDSSEERRQSHEREDQPD
jgi:hypothetical protein